MAYNPPAGAGGAAASNSDQEWVKPENCNCDCCNSNNEGGGGDNSTGYETGKEPGEGGIEMGGGEEGSGGEGGNVYASANESEVPVGQIYNGADVFYTGGNQGAGGYQGGGNAPVAKTFDDYYQDRQYHDFLLGLNDAEITFFRNHPSFIPDAYMNKTISENLADRYWNHGNWNDNNGNAFKHALWSALNAKSFGIDLAKELALAHESGPDNPPIQYKMDMPNNYLGISLYTYLKNNYPYELSGYLLGMTINGSITNGAGYRIVNNELVPTNDDGYIE